MKPFTLGGSSRPKSLLPQRQGGCKIYPVLGVFVCMTASLPKKTVRDELLSVKWVEFESIWSKSKLKNWQYHWNHTTLLLTSPRWKFLDTSNLHLFSTYISRTKRLAELILLMAIERTFFTQKCSSLLITHLPQPKEIETFETVPNLYLHLSCDIFWLDTFYISSIAIAIQLTYFCRRVHHPTAFQLAHLFADCSLGLANRWLIIDGCKNCISNYTWTVTPCWVTMLPSYHHTKHLKDGISTTPDGRAVTHVQIFPSTFVFGGHRYIFIDKQVGAWPRLHMKKRAQDGLTHSCIKLVTHIHISSYLKICHPHVQIVIWPYLWIIFNPNFSIFIASSQAISCQNY